MKNPSSGNQVVSCRHTEGRTGWWKWRSFPQFYERV